MTPQEMRNVLADIKYKHGYMLICRPFKSDGVIERHYLQVSASIPFPPPMRGARIWKGRKWSLSAHMTVSELVLTAFKAFETFEIHECREAFSFRGQKVCSPHLDVEQLAGLLADGQLEEVERR